MYNSHPDRLAQAHAIIIRVLSPDAQLWPKDYNEREGFTKDDYILAVGDAGNDFIIGAAASEFVLIPSTPSFSDCRALNSALFHVGL